MENIYDFITKNLKIEYENRFDKEENCWGLFCVDRNHLMIYHDKIGFIYKKNGKYTMIHLLKLIDLDSKFTKNWKEFSNDDNNFRAIIDIFCMEISPDEYIDLQKKMSNGIWKDVFSNGGEEANHIEYLSYHIVDKDFTLIDDAKMLITEDQIKKSIIIKVVIEDNYL